LNSFIPGLAAAVKDPDKRVRVQVVRALGRTGDQAAIEALISAVHDDDWAVAVSAVEALAKIGGKADEELMKIARDPGSTVNKRASELIKEKGIKPGAVVNITFGSEKE